MSRFLIALGLAIRVVGLLWPILQKVGIGRLPGDVVMRRDNFTLYVPIATCILLSLAFSFALWLLNR